MIPPTLARSNPEDLLAVDIFFDMRAVHGDIGLSNAIRREASDAADGQVAFVKLLAAAAGAIESGLTFFCGFRTANGRVDLKKCGLFGIVTAARTVAICHHVVERSTPARLAGIKALNLGGDRDLDALGEAQGIFLDLILAQQIEDIQHGIPPSNTMEIKRLSPRARELPHFALASVGQPDELMRELLF